MQIPTVLVQDLHQQIFPYTKKSTTFREAVKIKDITGWFWQIHHPNSFASIQVAFPSGKIYL